MKRPGRALHEGPAGGRPEAWSLCRVAKVWVSQYGMRGRVTGSEGRKVKGKGLKVTERTPPCNF